MRLDMHAHTCWSADSNLALPDLERAVRRAGLDAICITDHNEIDGALELVRRGEVRVIVGEEVRTAGGDIIGLFLRERIPPWLSPSDTVAAIREQGGVVYVPHPFDSFRTSRLRPGVLEALLPLVDVLEVFNARNVRMVENVEARAFARRHSLRGGAGSDSHAATEVGNACVELPAFSSPPELLRALDHGVIHGRRTNPLVHVRTKLDKLRRARRRTALSS